MWVNLIAFDFDVLEKWNMISLTQWKRQKIFKVQFKQTFETWDLKRTLTQEWAHNRDVISRSKPKKLSKKIVNNGEI